MYQTNRSIFGINESGSYVAPTELANHSYIVSINIRSRCGSRYLGVAPAEQDVNVNRDIQK